MKVVFAIDRNGLMGELGEWLKLAVDSVRLNTNLQPFVLVDGLTEAFKEWLHNNGVSYAEAETPLSEKINQLNKASGYPTQAKGNYLRYEATRILEDDFFLYADCDVIFLSNANELNNTPKLISAAPADIPFSYSSFNSGVLFVNRLKFLEILPEFYYFCAENLLNFFPGFDQAALNSFFAKKIEVLPVNLNWRPHWGATEDAAILHFHGVKIRTLELAMDGLLAIQGPKSEQVLDLTAKTLTNLPFFVGKIDRQLISRHSLLQRIEALSIRSMRIMSAPILENIRHGVGMRNSLEAGLRSRFLSQTYSLHVESRSISAKRVDLFPANHKKLRVVIRTEAPSLSVSNFMTDGSKEKYDISFCMSSNVIYGDKFEFDGIKYTNIQALDTGKTLDFIFDNNISNENELNILEEKLSLSILSLTPVMIEFYWTDDNEFNAHNVKFSFLK